MRQVHKAGEKLFVDYAGQHPHLVDARTGEQIDVELFVAVLGASNYTYAEATLTQRVPDFLASHTRAVEYFGGVSRLVVPDQLRTGVSDPCRYEPGVQRSYADWARHYGDGHPARASRETARQGQGRSGRAGRRALDPGAPAPRDLLHAGRAERADRRAPRGPERPPDEGLRRAVAPHALRAIRPSGAAPRCPRIGMSTRNGSRRASTSTTTSTSIITSTRCRIRSSSSDVEVCLTAATVEIFHRGQRVWLHVRSPQRGGYTTIPEHMPKAHRAHLEWTPTRLIHWAGTIGPAVAALATAILESRPHPEQGYRSCLGLMRLAKRHGPERLDAACARALAAGARSYKHVDSILKHGLDRLPLDAAAAPPPAPRIPREHPRRRVLPGRARRRTLHADRHRRAPVHGGRVGRCGARPALASRPEGVTRC